MKTFYDKILEDKYLFLFILSFAYMQSIYSRILVRGDFNIYTFTPEAAAAKLIEVYILFLIFDFFVRFWKESDIFGTKDSIKIFSSSIIIYLLVLQINNVLISFIFGNIERNFNRETITLSTFTHLLDGFIYGSFILAYYYYQNNKRHNEQLVSYNQALS